MRSHRALFLWCVALIGVITSNVSNLTAQETELRVAGRTVEEWAVDLDSMDELIRIRAAKSLGSFGETAIEPLTRALSNGSEGAEYWAASHLGNLGPAAESALPELLRIATNRPLPGKQLAVSFALCRIIPPQTSDAEQAAARTEAFELLIERLHHPERSMVMAAADFLGRLGTAGAPAIGALEEVYYQHDLTPNPIRVKDPDYHLRGACQNALRAIDPQWKPSRFD